MRRWIVAYYLATPLFAVVDLAAGWNVRLAALAGRPGLRVSYYVVCLVLGVAAWRRPRMVPLTALTESAVNLLLLFAGIAATYAGVLDAALQGEFINPFTPAYLLNFGLSGGMLTAGFYARLGALQKSGVR
jgi:hypothetical protein